MIDFVRMRQLMKTEERLCWALIRERAKAEKSTATLSMNGSRGGETHSRTEDGAIALSVLTDEYNQITAELELQRKELKKYMWRLSDMRRTVMKLRYMKGMSCRKIAEGLNYSRDHICHMVKAAELEIETMQSRQKHSTP